MRHRNGVKQIAAVFIVSLLALGFSGCSDDEQSSPSCLNEYDVSSLLANYGDRVIPSRYADLKISTTVLQGFGKNFLENPSITLLQAFRDTYKETYLDWQRVSAFNFGPAETHFLQSTFNNYPLNESKAYADAQAGDTDFSSPDEYNKGLPLLDYFLYGLGSDDEAIVDSFATNPKLREYTQAVLDDMLTTIDQVAADWSTYKNTFKANTGTRDGESLSLLLNGFNEDYEFIKRNKIGVASGVLSLGFTNPKEIEAYHSGLSLELLETAVASSRSIFEGRYGQTTNAEGLDDVLRSLNTDKNGQNLTDVILEQYDLIEEKLANVDGPLSKAVDQDKEDVVALYNALSEQVIYLKSDMPSVMCIAITYVDNPSDSD